MILLGWITLAFAGVYPATLLIPAIICAVLTVYFRPWDARSNPAPGLDRLLAASVALTVLQLIPLPLWFVDRISPADRATWSRLMLNGNATSLPLSIDLVATGWAAAVWAATVTIFLVARKIFVGGGIRIVVRGVAAIGLVLSAVALAQDATGHGLMYWTWRPLEEGAPPFGPFVDRNHFATWVVLAVPLCLGYLAAHASAHVPKSIPGTSWHRRVLALLDSRAIWLVSSMAMMVVALVVSLSRSGLFAMATALVTGAAFHNRRTSLTIGRRWMVAALGLALVLIALRADPGAITDRISGLPIAAEGRVEIWRATLPVLKDFWATGSGAGTFETAMLAYQNAPATFRINAAHNQYLQLAVEGGLLLGIPVGAALVMFASTALRIMRTEQSGMYWLRAGALSGLAGIAVQSIWETGLTTPANAVLAAIAAAIALHRPHHRES